MRVNKKSEKKISTSDWLIKIDELVKNGEEVQMAHAEQARWQQPSIYKLPAYVTNSNQKAYTPKAVSFGPYHCGNENLRPMEEHKERALIHMLKRSKVSIKQCFQSLREIVRDLMVVYYSLDPYFKQNEDAFLKLMVRDGFFMLELFHFQQWSMSDSRGGEFEGYAGNDPIFSEHGRLHVMPVIKQDMLQVENQLPMKLLHKLSQLQQMKEHDPDKLAFNFFFHKRRFEAPSNSLHILDMYRNSILGPDMEQKNSNTSYIPAQGIVRSAVELDKAGIKIVRTSLNYLRDIQFKNGILRLPPIKIDHLTESLYLNLIAYERFHVGAGNQLVTDHVFFMDQIIVDAMDVRLLHSKNIIHNGIGDKAAIKLFKSLSRDICHNMNSPFGEVYNRVDVTCKYTQPRHSRGWIASQYEEF